MTGATNGAPMLIQELPCLAGQSTSDRKQQRSAPDKVQRGPSAQAGILALQCGEQSQVNTLRVLQPPAAQIDHGSDTAAD